MKEKLSHLPIYQSAIVAVDILLSIGAYAAVLWLSGWFHFASNPPGAILIIAFLSLTTISFFPSYQLYSYNFLFSRKEHLKRMGKAFCWSFLTLGIIIFLFNSANLLEEHFHVFTAIIVVGAIILLLLSRYFWDHLVDFIMAFGIAFLFMGITGLIYEEKIQFPMTNAPLLFSCFLLAVVFLLANRFFLVHVVFNTWLRKQFRRQVVIIGSNNEADAIAELILENNAPFWIIGNIGPQSSPLHVKEDIHKSWLGEIKELQSIATQHDVDDLIITDEHIDKATLVSILDYCTSEKINAWFSPRLLPILNIKLRPDFFCGKPMILLGSQKNTWLYDKTKYLVDLLITLPVFVLQLPIFLFIMAAIKLDSEGPVFYKAKAIGKDGRVFFMFKFRSMRVDSDNEIHKNYVSKLIKGEIGNDGEEEKPLKITDDPRVTKVGRILRKWSLDELPQLLNVLKGDMSLVGPRPCLPYEFDMYQDWCKKRTAAQGGITGLWQIAGRSSVAFEDMILLDLYYIYNRSVSLDFNILFETVFVVLGKKGAY